MPAFDGKAALVTGGTAGIGLAIAERLCREGARVVVTGRDEPRGRAAEQRLGDRARFVAADAGDETAVDHSVRFALEAMGRLDVLVNNAGIALTERLLDTPVSEFDRLMAANVRSAFLYARACMPLLAESEGSMVHVASDAGLRGEQAIGAYSVTKAAVVMMSKMLALDGASAGVRSNCVCPGATAPGMLHIGPADDPERGDDPSAWPIPPLGRIGRAEDIAAAVAFLAGDEASFMSGAVLLVDGANGAGLPA
ncbi:SDR family NAD(P)-dependent oxidoreductase [Candidatus Solirubrobacter pratensis]|uniref:SDR family NAD(P)-dependent oxidoreductase n=1 Tax=Candidatus Solirubrobacter pratensis TaxID=1298857 RepID=UPI00055B0FFC|nr:glucose 1-dehydrogenase [Candidatus Solirubrobacter pratensis]